jgi:energy-coupling factor transporter ATP-binding protein EcfA2
MSIWDSYPADYRAREVSAILAAVRAGECVSVVGLSGAGKSNLLGFIAHRVPIQSNNTWFALVDCNRLGREGLEAFIEVTRQAVEAGDTAPHRLDIPRSAPGDWSILEGDVTNCLDETSRLCLLFDRFDALSSNIVPTVYSNLRALRDAHKYLLTFVAATRRPLDPTSELAELFYANTLWLGPLSDSNARWSVAQYALRKGLEWDETVIGKLVELSWGYPSFLRAAGEAYASGADLDLESLHLNPAIERRVQEFWADQPGDEDLRRCGLAGHPLLEKKPARRSAMLGMDSSDLTAKEHLLLAYFLEHAGEVCEKDDLIQAVWPEDKIFEQGIRDDSLAQLVRRLRKKIEPDPAAPRRIHTIPGRGYRFKPGE